MTIVRLSAAQVKNTLIHAGDGKGFTYADGSKPVLTPDHNFIFIVGYWFSTLRVMEILQNKRAHAYVEGVDSDQFNKDQNEASMLMVRGQLAQLIKMAEAAGIVFTVTLEPHAFADKNGHKMVSHIEFAGK